MILLRHFSRQLRIEPGGVSPNGPFWSQGSIHSAKVLNICYVPAVFLMVKDEEILTQRPGMARGHRFSKQTHSPITTQSGKQSSTCGVAGEKKESGSIWKQEEIVTRSDL